MKRPYVLLSVATSLDGHIDDATPERLILSNEEDLDRVDAERAAADAILVGAATIAADDPRLLVRSATRRAERVARGAPPSPIKVTITRTGRGLDPGAKFFTTGDGAKLVYAPAVADLERRLAGLATVVAAPDLPSVLADLADQVSPRVLRAPGRLDEVVRELDEYFEGRRSVFDLPLDLRLARGFRRDVLTHLREIRYGATESYRTVAAATGHPNAARAVGSACRVNPLPIVIPCHRVVRSDGTPGEYAGGVEAKRRLLALESTAA